MDKIYKFDIAIVFVSVAVLIFLVGYARPLVIAPVDDYSSVQGEVLFNIEKADKLLIDDNIDFTTPEGYILEDDLKIELEPGKYYWKAVGVLGSEIRTFTIQSYVSLKLKKFEGDSDSYNVVNAGNVKLNVDVYDGEEIVDRLKISVGDEKISSGNKFVGGQE